MVFGRPSNSPAFRRLHHPGILHMCSTTPGGHYYQGRSWGRQPVCFCLASYLSKPLGVYTCGLFVLLTLFALLTLFVCLPHRCPSVFLSCLSFNLTSHYSCSVRGRGSFISAALCCYVVVSYKRPI